MNPHAHATPGGVLGRTPDASSHHPPLSVPVGPVQLEGELVIPRAAAGVVIFAHGSGSSRHSPRNQFVASTLQEAGLATVLLNLFTPNETREAEVSGAPRFNVELMAHRLACAVQWLEARELLDGPVGLFGSGTGAAAAVIAAARRPDIVAAIVCRGGRPDLAGRALPAVLAPTLLIVGGADTTVLELNRQAYNRLRCPRELAIVPGATHLFEEPGALEDVADLAVAWFSRHLSGGLADGIRASAQT